MATAGYTVQLQEALRNQTKTGLYGRREGLDRYDYQVGPLDTRVQIEAFTSTLGGSLSSWGISVLAVTAGSSVAFTMSGPDAVGPVPGLQSKIIVCATTTVTTAAQMYVQLSTAVGILSTLGSSYNQIQFSCAGAAIELTAISSRQWMTKYTPNTGITLSTI